jgi:hypothetical protein
LVPPLVGNSDPYVLDDITLPHVVSNAHSLPGNAKERIVVPNDINSLSGRCREVMLASWQHSD